MPKFLTEVWRTSGVYGGRGGSTSAHGAKLTDPPRREPVDPAFVLLSSVDDSRAPCQHYYTYVYGIRRSDHTPSIAKYLSFLFFKNNFD
jgi:hypothetical protein